MDGTFNDYETSIVPFEIPHFVSEYVNNKVAKTQGLRLDPDTGIIVDYIPDPDEPDNVVVIPSYMSVDNHDGTFESVKVKGIVPGLFKDNKDIVGVQLGNFITEIPDSAFEGCSSLKYVLAPGVTKIGNHAFSGCISLDTFTLPMDVTELGMLITVRELQAPKARLPIEVTEFGISILERERHPLNAHPPMDVTELVI